MTSATVATKPAAAQSGQSQAKPEKIRKDHSINWWLTAAVAVLSLALLLLVQLRDRITGKSTQD